MTGEQAALLTPAEARVLIHEQREIAYAAEAEIERLMGLLGGVCIEDDLHVHKRFCLTCGWNLADHCGQHKHSRSAGSLPCPVCSRWIRPDELAPSRLPARGDTDLSRNLP